MGTYPTTVEQLMEGATISYDQVNSLEEPPSWLDKERFRRGQAFVKRHFFGVILANTMAMTASCLWEPVFRTLTFYGKFKTTRTLLRLSLSMMIQTVTWYLGDIWDPEDAAYKSVKNVQQVHLNLGKFANKNKEKVKQSMLDTSKYPDILKKCTFLGHVKEDFEAPGHKYSSSCPFQLPQGHVYMSQTDLALAALGTISGVLLAPEKLGIHGASDKEIGDYVYFWRVICFHMGVKDKFNSCSGTLEEVRGLSWDFVDKVLVPNMKGSTEEYEYFSRCVLRSYEKFSFLFRVAGCFPEACIAYGFWILNMSDILNSSFKHIPWYSAVLLLLAKFCFYIVFRFRPIVALINFVTRSYLSGKKAKNDLKELTMQLN